jgi:hypothetical protein
VARGNDSPNGGPSGADVGDIFPTFDPSSVAAGTGSDPAGTGSDPAGTGADHPVRTRKRRADAGKSRGGTKAKGAPLDLNGLEGLLLAVHISLSAITGEEALQLQPEEAHAVAEAASNVSRHYDIRASQKVLDWGALGFVLAGIYGPRAAFIYQKSRAPKPPPPQRPAERPASNGKTAPDAFVVAAAQPWNG